MALPEVAERLSHNATCFYVRKRTLCYVQSSELSQHGGATMICPAPAGAPAELVVSEPTRFFHPQPSASGVFSTWLGVYLEATGTVAVDWSEVSDILVEAYRLIAPKKLILRLCES